MKEQYKVSGMTCAACSSAVERAVSKVSGVSAVEVNLLDNSMKIDYDSTQTDSKAIINAVEKAGYHAALPNAKATQQSGESESEHPADAMKKRLILSLIHI